MPRETLRIIINAEENAAQAVQRLRQQLGGATDASEEATEAVGGLSGGLGALKSIIPAIGIGLLVNKFRKFTQESILTAARVRTLGVVTEQLGENIGYTVTEVREIEQAIQEKGITTQKSRQAVAQMVQAQIDLKHSTDLARIAQNAAVIANTNSSEAYQRLVTVIARGSTRMARRLGIIVDFQGAYERFAESVGKSTNELTAEEKVAARTNEVLRAGQNITGTYEAAMETAGKQMGSYARHFEELQREVGLLFQRDLKAGIAILTDVTDAFRKFFEEVNKERHQQRKLEEQLKAGDITLNQYMQSMEASREAVRKEHGFTVEFTDAIGDLNAMRDWQIEQVYGLTRAQIILYRAQEQNRDILANTNPILLEAMGIYQATEEQLKSRTNVAIQGMTDEMVENAEAAMRAKEKIGNWLDEIDRDISSPIESLVKDLQWTIATQGRFEDAFGTIEEGLREGVVPPEEAKGELQELFVLTQDMREEMGIISEEEAVENIEDLLGISPEEAKGMLEDTQGTLEVLQELRGEMLDFELGAFYGEGDRTYGDPTQPATALLPTPSQEAMDYTIKWGDTLSGIAEDTGTTVDNLMDMNDQIKDPNLILAGEELRVPLKNASEDVDNINQSLDDISGRDYEFNLRMNIVPTTPSGQMSEQQKDLMLEHFFNRLGR